MSVRSAMLPGMEIVVIVLALAVGVALGAAWARIRLPAAALADRAADAAVVKEGLERLHDQLRDLEGHRISWQSQLAQQVSDMRVTAESLRRETAGLATALRRPQVRGQWGELHLRRAVELAGLVDRCDFSEQHTLAGGRLRPDLVVHLAGGKNVAVDAKVPLDAFLDATSTQDPDEYSAALTRHARQLRQHVDALAGKAYWRALPASPEFVVLFVPGDSFLAAALEAEPQLIEYAAGRHVVLATPTTLIALLRTVAYAWTHEALNDRAREIHDLGVELHDRLGTMGAHLDRLGRSLTAAVGSYNAAIGSLESRVLVSARRFSELSPSAPELEPPRVVEDAPRPLSAAELLDHDLRVVGSGDTRWSSSDPRPSGGHVGRDRRREVPRRSPPTGPSAWRGRQTRAPPYRGHVSGQRTLWEEGRFTGRLVACAASAGAVVVVLLNLVGAGQIGLFFDLSFVLICVAAALAVRPREFFVVGVLPPLLMAGTVTLLALVDRTAVADADDSLVQAIVSGLTHHATALVVGYALTLAILALRQVARATTAGCGPQPVAEPRVGLRQGSRLPCGHPPVPAARSRTNRRMSPSRPRLPHAGGSGIVTCGAQVLGAARAAARRSATPRRCAPPRRRGSRARPGTPARPERGPRARDAPEVTPTERDAVEPGLLDLGRVVDPVGRLGAGFERHLDQADGVGGVAPSRRRSPGPRRVAISLTATWRFWVA